MPSSAQIVIIVSAGKETNRAQILRARLEFPEADLYLIYEGTMPSKVNGCEMVPAGEFHVSSDHHYVMVANSHFTGGDRIALFIQLLATIICARPQSIEVFRLEKGAAKKSIFKR